MSKLAYPLRVVFEGGTDWDGLPLSGYQVHGPFRCPGELWKWANRECYVNVYRGWRKDMNVLIQKNAARGWRAIKVALDEWAIQDLEAYDYAEASRARVLQGDAAWREWQRDGQEQDAAYSAPPNGFYAAGPMPSCGCEDWPCCVHTDDYIYLPC